jgi:hypothetical protein
MHVAVLRRHFWDGPVPKSIWYEVARQQVSRMSHGKEGLLVEKRRINVARSVDDGFNTDFIPSDPIQESEIPDQVNPYALPKTFLWRSNFREDEQKFANFTQFSYKFICPARPHVI